MTARTAGQTLAAELRAAFRVGTRTCNWRAGLNLREEMIEAIENATRWPGYYTGRRHEVFTKAWVIACSWRKHIDGHRIDPVLRSRITQMSLWQIANLLGRMVDAGVRT